MVNAVVTIIERRSQAIIVHGSLGLSRSFQCRRFTAPHLSLSLLSLFPSSLHLTHPQHDHHTPTTLTHKQHTTTLNLTLFSTTLFNRSSSHLCSSRSPFQPTLSQHSPITMAKVSCTSPSCYFNSCPSLLLFIFSLSISPPPLVDCCVVAQGC
jgi:hypothetical protein